MIRIPDDRERPFERYEDGELTIQQLATDADMSLGQALVELRERGIHFRYSDESLHEDLPDAGGGEDSGTDPSV